MDNADARSCRANVTGFFEIPLPPTNNFFMVVNKNRFDVLKSLTT